MTSIIKRAFAFALSLILMLGAVPVLAADNADASATVSMPSVTDTKNVIRAAFTASEITLNGLMTEEGWNVITKIGDNASVGAQWDFENLYLAVRNEKKEAITVTVGGVTLSGDNSQSKTSSNKMNTEYIVSLDTLGVTVENYNTEIDTKITVGSASWEGVIRLTSIDWFAADNANKRSQNSGISRSGMRLVHEWSQPTQAQGGSTIMGGYNFFDRYDANASRSAISIRTSLTYSGDAYAPIGDRTADTIVEFDFLARSMPVYELGTENDFWGEYPNCGFFWYLRDNASYYNNFITMAIVNTDSGLSFVLNTSELKVNGPVYSCSLNKQLGEMFRVGINWTTDGDVILYVDSEIIKVIENADSTHRRMTSANIMTMGIARSAEIADSSEDDFDIDITNLAMGKYYGENLIDALGFWTIQGENEATDAIIKSLTLPTAWKHPQFEKTLTLKWESSDPSVIDPATGKVTQPVTNGKIVTLTATDTESGLTKSFDLYVKGLAPESDVLAVLNDVAAYEGKGTVQDVYEFTLDTSNNSIIRDLKETKTVNVIALKDSDEINKLSEQMLTIWTSDDNKTYTQVPSFKLLRDGMYTYLYNFEATGRYIKVHCTTHTTRDCDFIGPLNEMIDAYYEDVFGDNGSAFATESSYTLTNGTDTAKFDEIVKISVADAGVQCADENNADVRFYLDGDLLYHYFDGTDFYVRVTKIPKNSSVTLKILSGNANAMDISNKTNVYEIVYGTIETDPSLSARYTTTLSNGRIIAFSAQSEYGTPFKFCISDDQGRTWSGYLTAVGTSNLCVPQGAIYDEAANRIIVTGYTRIRDAGGNNIGLMTHYAYSDDMGRSWKEAPLTQLGDYQSDYLLSYAQIAMVSASYDGEDGPGVDFVHVLNCHSPAVTEYYNNRYGHNVARVAYTTDGGKTWTLSPDDIAFYDGEAQGEHAHTREHGVCEAHILEAKDGTVVVYSRCQYDNVYTLCRAFSYDHGKTWTKEVELSDVYSVNTQPYLFNFGDNQFMMWGGNNMFGQGSFRRYPLSIAVSYDNLITFEGVLDLFSKTAFQGMLTATSIDNTNTQITKSGDAILLTNSSTSGKMGTLRINNFSDYFFKTRGAYDTFEQTDPEWEGWATTGGEITHSDAQASEGKYSMRIATGASANRSIPYIQNGTVSFDLFIEDVDKAKFEFEFECSYGFEYGLAAPIAFRLNGNKATFLGASSATALDLKDGWNLFTFTLDMLNETPAASLSVNGGNAIAVPVNAEIGNYASFVHVRGLGELEYYLDEFLVIDEDNAFVPDIIVSAESAALTELTEDLTKNYDDVAAFTAAMQSFVLEGADETYLSENTAIYTLSPIISKDGGDTWAEATVYDIPLAGMTVKIAYPEGTAANTHAFRALALVTDDDRKTDDYGKMLTVTEGEDGLYVKTYSSYPVILSWAEFIDPTPDVPDDTTAATPGSISSLVWIGIGVGALVIVASVVFIALKSKKKNA